MESCVVTILKRYDVNGAWTHDIKLGKFTPPETSMWKVYKCVNVLDLINELEGLESYLKSTEEECEDLTEQNRLLTIRIKELTKK
jgi:hypothetical protein